MKKDTLKKVFVCGLLGIFLMSGCGNTTDSYANMNVPNQGMSTLQPVSSCYATESIGEKESVVEPTLATYTSTDGLCIIEVKEDYFDVTLDYESGSYAEIGTAYAEAILLAYPEYESVMEPYVYENIRNAFSNSVEDFNIVYERIRTLEASLPEEYQEEMEAFASKMSGEITGFTQDGKLSYEEAKLAQMVPDALRGTSCSAISVWGEKSASGARMTARVLEWALGSENQMCTAHCVLHMKNGEKSLTSITVLGLFNVLTAINDNGVMAGCLDVGSEETYQCEGKTCYSYAIRYALETFDNATDVGNYMVEHSDTFTFSHNMLISDENHTYCAEDCVAESRGQAVLRDENSILTNGVVWRNPDSFCIINSFITEGNYDNITGDECNIVRWEKYNNWIGSLDQFTLGNMEAMLTHEDPEVENVMDVYSENVYQIVLMDYATGEIHVLFTGIDGVNPDNSFVNIGYAY